MMWIGHRGLAGLAPENTLAGIRAAAAHGLAMVEFDVRLTRDGVPVVFHDDGLGRTTNGSGAVAERDWAEIAHLDAGSWFSPAFAKEPVPRLEDVLRLCLELGLAVNMEIKPDAERAAETVERALAQAQAIWPDQAPVPLISSFLPACLEASARLAPRWPRAILAERLSAHWRAQAIRLGAGGIHLAAASLTREAVEELAAEGLDVRAYTVNDPALAATLKAWGVAALFSDFPHSS